MEHMKNNHKMAALRDYLEEKVLELVPECIVNGKKADRLPNTANICFKNASGEALLQLLDEVGIAVSTTSACHSNDQEPSHVLSAMGISPNYVRGALRISLSHDSNKREVDFFLEQISRAAEHSRTNSPALY